MTLYLSKFVRSHLDVLLHTGLVILPLLAFTAILIGLVCLNMWDRSNTRTDDLPLSSGYFSDTLYVNYSATSLILVASWSSSVAVPLIGSLLTLVSFVVAADMIWMSEKSYQNLLPTPAQLGLLTDLLDGKKMALLTWISGMWRRGDQKVFSRWVIELPAGIQLAGLFISLAIVATDTWLHVATSSNSLWYLDGIDNITAMGPAYHYSRNLTSDCFDQSEGICSVKLMNGLNRTAFAADVRDLLVDNPRSDTKVNSSANGTLFLAPRLPSQADLQSSSSVAYQTFTASTFSVNASCINNISVCHVSQNNASSNSWQFSCPDGMSGSLTSREWLSISSWWQPIGSVGTFDMMWSHYGDSVWDSTIEIGLAAFFEDVIFDSGGNVTQIEFQQDQNEHPVRGSAITCRCNLTMQGLSYDWTNATSTPAAQNVTLSSVAANLARAPLLAGYFNSGDFDVEQKEKLVTMLSGSSNFTGDILQRVQDVVGHVGLSLLGGTLRSTPATALALGNSAIVTKVGKGPLFTLVILNLWYAGFAGLLFCLVVYILRDETTRQDIIEVQKLITVNGLATSAVSQQRDDLSSRGPNVRVGVEKVDCKWQFRIFESLDSTDEGKRLLGTED
ncbi:hypothetical protein LTR70_001937 [Exophiala xenobiotica]|uniref:Uncharacterized protein n=1 Tax=Lithohypha guttulata TaxID=1690604 RepID=A0ABR0K925_9EURO|nr:hypothetical protein LTR24_005392 [Lithohypha guttulata]KAK5326922.1 hypothetical protein LTR70_001937 [Exophiala xenobiotica]